MEIAALLNIVINALEDLKAKDIKVLDVRNLSSITDTMVIASGTSSRQVVALGEKVIESVKEHGLQPLGSEGMTEGEWVLVDLGDIIVHVMLPQTRDFYQLEKLWAEMGQEADKIIPLQR